MSTAILDRTHRALVLWAGLLVVGVLLPLCYLVVHALDATAPELRELFLRPRNATLLWNTLRLIVAVLLASTAIAAPLAWLTTRTDLRYKRVFAWLGVMPLALPAYLMAYALLSLGGNIGVLAELTGWSAPRLSGFWGALIVLTLCNFPYLFFNLRTAFLTLDPALEEIAESLGRSRRDILARVYLPQLKPAFFAGSLLIALHVLADFAAVGLMRFETFSYVLYVQYNSAFDRTYAACLALFLILITVLMLGTEAWFLRGVRLDRTGALSVRAAKPRPLGAWAAPAYGFLALLVFVSLLVPVAAMVYWATRADLAALAPDILSSLIGSVSASLPAAVLATAMVVPIVYLSLRAPSRLTRAIERSTYIGYATPAIAFALGLVFFSLRIVPALYQTLFLLIYGYAMHYLAEAVGPVRSALYQTSARTEEAARALGYGWLRTLWKVTLPLVRNGLFVSMAFIFLSCMKELHLTFILSPLGYSTLAIDVWGLIEEAFFAQAAPYALTILAFSGLFVGLLLLQEKRYV